MRRRYFYDQVEHDPVKGEYQKWQKLSIHLLCGPQQQDIDVLLEPAQAQKWISTLQALQSGNLTGVTQGVTG